MAVVHDSFCQLNPSFPLQTFGVELEFIVRYNPAKYEARAPTRVAFNWRNVYDHVTDVLCSAGYPVNQPQVPSEERRGTNNLTSRFATDIISRWTVAYDTSIKLNEKKSFPMENNTISRRRAEKQTRQHSDDALLSWKDSRFCPTKQLSSDSGGSEYAAIELKSPVLPVGSKSFQTVHDVVSLLNESFDIHCNESTGLHVHVGYGEHGFALQTLRNLAQIVTAFQLQIDSLHTPSRLNNHWCFRTSDNLENVSLDRSYGITSPITPQSSKHGPFNIQHRAEQNYLECQELISVAHENGHRSQSYVSVSGTHSHDIHYSRNSRVAGGEREKAQGTNQRSITTRTISENGQMLPMDMGASALISLLDEIENVEDLVCLMQPDNERYHAYNFKSLDKYGTVEFRQHVGTMEADRIISWVDFVTGLVHFCEMIPTEAASRLIATFGPARLSYQAIESMGIADTSDDNYSDDDYDDADEDDSRRTNNPCNSAQWFSVLDLCHVIRKPNLADFYREELRYICPSISDSKCFMTLCGLLS